MTGGVGVAWQGRQLVHPADDVRHRRPHVSADIEPQIHGAAAGVRKRVELLQAWQALQGCFLWFDEFRFHLSGRCCAPAGEDRHLRLFDVREQLDRKFERAVTPNAMTRAIVMITAAGLRSEPSVSFTYTPSLRAAMNHHLQRSTP